VRPASRLFGEEPLGGNLQSSWWGATSMPSRRCSSCAAHLGCDVGPPHRSGGERLKLRDEGSAVLVVSEELESSSSGDEIMVLARPAVAAAGVALM